MPRLIASWRMDFVSAVRQLDSAPIWEKPTTSGFDSLPESDDDFFEHEEKAKTQAAIAAHVRRRTDARRRREPSRERVEALRGM